MSSTLGKMCSREYARSRTEKSLVPVVKRLDLGESLVGHRIVHGF